MNELEKLNNKDLITNQINFSLKSDFTPTGDQPNAIKELISGINNNEKEGATWSDWFWKNFYHGSCY